MTTTAWQDVEAAEGGNSAPPIAAFGYLPRPDGHWLPPKSWRAIFNMWGKGQGIPVREPIERHNAWRCLLPHLPVNWTTTLPSSRTVDQRRLVVSPTVATASLFEATAKWSIQVRRGGAPANVELFISCKGHTLPFSALLAQDHRTSQNVRLDKWKEQFQFSHGRVFVVGYG